MKYIYPPSQIDNAHFDFGTFKKTLIQPNQRSRIQFIFCSEDWYIDYVNKIGWSIWDGGSNIKTFPWFCFLHSKRRQQKQWTQGSICLLFILWKMFQDFTISIISRMSLHSNFQWINHGTTSISLIFPFSCNSKTTSTKFLWTHEIRQVQSTDTITYIKVSITTSNQTHQGTQQQNIRKTKPYNLFLPLHVHSASWGGFFSHLLMLN